MAKHNLIFEEGTPEAEMMRLFDDLSFSEKWSKVFEGLKMPPETGAYKFARLQLIRLLAPISAIVVPLLALLLIGILSQFQPPPRAAVETQVIEQPEPPPLDKIEELKEPPPVPPDPVEVEFKPDVVVNNVNPAPATEFSPVPAKFDSVAIIKSPVIMKGILGSRNPGARGQALRAFGGSGETEGAVMRALRWLKKVQKSDGSWDGGGDTAGGPNNGARSAMTGMAILSYLAHGERPDSEEFGETVERALKFMLEAQKGNGHFSHSDNHEYTVPIATYALAEASALIKVPALREAAEKSAMAVANGQHASGGWNYNLNSEDRDDTSYMGWCAQSMKAAKMAGLADQTKISHALKRSIAGFKKNWGAGGFGYTGPIGNRKYGKSGAGLTGVGVLCTQLAGEPQAKEVLEGLNIIAQHSTVSWQEEQIRGNIYFWYYETQAMFHHGKEYWQNWNPMFSRALVDSQQIIKGGIADPTGKMVDIGYWDPPPEKGHSAGRVQDTCLCALQLQVYYRYLPTYKPPAELEAVVDHADQQEKKAEEVGIEIVL